MTMPQSFRDDPFLSAKNIMEILNKDKKTGLKRQSVYNKIRFEMKHYRVARRVFVRQSDFQNWLERQSWDPSSSLSR